MTTKRLAVTIPNDLHRELKVSALCRGISLKQLVSELLRNYVRTHPNVDQTFRARPLQPDGKDPG